jgi:hypothetical protein
MESKIITTPEEFAAALKAGHVIRSEPPLPTVHLTRDEASDAPTLRRALAKVDGDWSRITIGGTE